MRQKKTSAEYKSEPKANNLLLFKTFRRREQILKKMIKATLIFLLAVGSISALAPADIEDEPQPMTEEPEAPESFPDGECPEVDGEFPVYLPDLKNCSVFYQCANGVPYRMTCSYPLEFNPTLQVCDFPGVSGCIADQRVPFRVMGRCPLMPRPGLTKLLRDSMDNTIYYECVNGEPVMRKCPDGQIFTSRRGCIPPAFW